MTGKFFAIGKVEWARACSLGMNPACAFLVLARGTGRDNVTTSWSAQAVQQTCGIAWTRSKDAIVTLERSGLLALKKASKTRPTRKLALSGELESAIWLPNSLVDGVGGASSPVARLRQTGQVDYLQAFVELYAVHDLAGDGGLPRGLIWQSFTRTRICDTAQFVVFGFGVKESRCYSNGPLARFSKKADTPPAGESDSWRFLRTLENLGLLEVVPYLAESERPDSELLHALAGDAAADGTNEAALLAVCSLPEFVAKKAEWHACEYVLPVIRSIPEPAVVGVYRLTHRPHTGLTAAWWAQHAEACKGFTAVYNAIARGDYRRAAAA